MSTARPILPREDDGNEKGNPADNNDVSSGPVNLPPRRKNTTAACEECRRRKIRCNGMTPICSNCATHDRECAYLNEGDHRRKEGLRKDIQLLSQQNERLRKDNLAWTGLAQTIRNGSNEDVQDIISLIRSKEPIGSIARALSSKTLRNLVQARELGSLDHELASFAEVSLNDPTDDIRYYGMTAGLGVGPAEQGRKAPSQPLSPQQRWTTVTNDWEFISHLLHLYFCWQHPVVHIFSRDLFLADMESGATKYCSRPLVNSVLSVACYLSDRPQARADPKDPLSAGTHFAAEAKRLFREDDDASLTNCQALGMLTIFEGLALRDNISSRYSIMMMAMAVELGLHQKDVVANRSDMTMIQARRITFWGCYYVEIPIAIGLGRLPLLPTQSITQEKLRPEDLADVEKVQWNPVLSEPRDRITAAQTILLHTYDWSMCELSLMNLINDMLFMFYAPTERLTGRKLLEFYSRYEKTLDGLPATMKLDESTTLTPMIAMLQAGYCTAIIHLFRPFLKVKLSDSSVVPREICLKLASRILSIVSQYRTTYGLRRINIQLIHCTMIAGTVLVTDLASDKGAAEMIQCLHLLIEMSPWHPWAVRLLHIVLFLINKSAQETGPLKPEVQAIVTKVQGVLLAIAQATQQTSSEAEMPEETDLLQGNVDMPPSEESPSLNTPLMSSADAAPPMGTIGSPPWYPPDFFYASLPGEHLPLQYEPYPRSRAYEQEQFGEQDVNLSIMHADGFIMQDLEWYSNQRGDQDQ